MNDYIVNRTLSIFLIIQLTVLSIIKRFPEWIETYYSHGIYPYISISLRRVLGFIPISIGDLIYFTFILLILRWLWYVYETRFTPYIDQIYRLLAFVSIILFLFHFLWGMNYYRLPLSKQYHLTSLKYDSIALKNTTEQHINKINQIHTQLVEYDSLIPKIPYSRKKIYKLAAQRYKNLTVDGLNLNFKVKSIKHSLISKPLAFMGFSGYLNPFTGEAQINKHIPISYYPITVTHEMAHQLGYASETEANYIGYLACAKHDDIYFNYSGELMVIGYLINEVSKFNKELGQTYFQNLNKGIRKNIIHNRDFWDSYKTALKPVSHGIYNQYLKANNQKKGIKSYNAMVGYLINHKPSD